ncbi:MAG: glycoside hydrolase family 3 C-terminal domain-containing protein, partial [Lachnospiraceae bacterium]|nr:glycoside hydrolase family 3 C-terminal domain-containing protein [Lachnospiraceae bacterium]
MMKKISRRDFLRGSAAGVAGVALSGIIGGTSSMAEEAASSSTAGSAQEKMYAQYQTAEDVAAEGIVLLENNGVLPMASSGTVALFGAAAFETLSNSRGETDLNGKTFTPNISSAFELAGYSVLTTAENAVGDELAETPDYVIYVISRSSAEGSDRTSGEGDYLLTEDEKAQMSSLAQAYGNVILILDLCAVTDFYNDYIAVNEETPDGIGAVVFTGLGGEGGGNAVVDVLNATGPVSGKLVDTWALNYEDYPSAATFGSAGHDNFSFSDNEYYAEGIYNGYRYFDTFNVESAYA